MLVNASFLPAFENVHHGAVRFTTGGRRRVCLFVVLKIGRFGSLNMLFTVEAMIFAKPASSYRWFGVVRGRRLRALGEPTTTRLSTMGINHRQRLFMEIRLASNGFTTPSSSPLDVPSPRWVP